MDKVVSRVYKVRRQDGTETTLENKSGALLKIGDAGHLRNLDNDFVPGKNPEYEHWTYTVIGYLSPPQHAEWMIAYEHALQEARARG